MHDFLDERNVFFLNVKEGLIVELIFYFVETKDKFFSMMNLCKSKAGKILFY